MRRSQQITIAIAVMCGIMGLSCEEKTGYFDAEQLGRIEMLTSVKWMKHTVWSGGDNSSVEGYETWHFEPTGRGIRTVRNEQNGVVTYHNVEYVQWTFTTENFAVIYMSMQTCGDSFWLIDRLTRTELCVSQASQDPVLYPGTHQIYEKYVAVVK